MAEFVASVIALIGTGITVAETIKKVVDGLRNAPEELLTLANEVSTTNQVLDGAQFVLSKHGTRSTVATDPSPINFGQVIGRANGIYIRINSNLNSLRAFEMKKGPLKHAQRVLWMKGKDQLLKLQHELRECRQEIIAFVGVENLLLVSHMAVQLSELHAMCLNAVSSTAILTSSTPSTSTTSIIPTSKSLSKPNVFSLTTSPASQSSTCDFPCGCTCHKQLRSSYDTGVLGTLFIGSCRSLFMSTACTERRCRGRSASDVRFTYYFPSWYIRKAVTFMYSGHGPQLCVRFANIIPEDHDLFGCAKTGDLKKLKYLLTSGQASPTDIDHDGDGLLICTLELKEFSLEMCNFVYTLPGVDPQTVNRFGQSFVSLAWQLILSMDPDTRQTDPLASWLISVITKYDYFEERQFRTLHKIVTNCSPIPLLDQLQTSTAEIDVPDASGWTPLMWATFRHNAEAIQYLLDYDANTTLLNNEGQHALHLGAWSWNPTKSDISAEVAAWERLVSKIPQVNHIDRYNWSPLMYAAGTARNVPLLKALVEAGADVNLSGHAGITALHWAAQVNRAEAVQYLVEAGAKIDTVTIEGKTPVHLAVSDNAHGSLGVLLDMGAADIEVLGIGRAESLLFEAARFADAKTLHILAEAELPEFGDLDAVRDEDGLTLQEAFEAARPEAPDADLVKSWDEFYGSLRDSWHDTLSS